MVFNFLKKKTGVHSLFPVAASEQIKNLPNVVFVDVREPDEVREGAAEGTINLPTSSFAVTQLPEDKTTPLFFICRSGGRSIKAAETAKSAGYSKVFNVDGGTLAWQAMGLPMK